MDEQSWQVRFCERMTCFIFQCRLRRSQSLQRNKMIVLGRHAKEKFQSALRLQCIRSHFQQEGLTNSFYTENYVSSRLWSTNKSNIATSDQKFICPILSRLKKMLWLLSHLNFFTSLKFIYRLYDWAYPRLLSSLFHVMSSSDSSLNPAEAQLKRYFCHERQFTLEFHAEEQVPKC